MTFGSVAAALLWQQLYFLSGKEGEKKPVRISYTNLQKHLPFFSKRWIIETAARLEDIGAIKIIKTTRVNKFEILDFSFNHEVTGQNTAHMLVFPELAAKVGLLEAIVLQQIHLRHWWLDGSSWFIRPLRQWHSDTFMFIGLATIQQVFSRLEKAGLLLTKPYTNETGKMKSYRVNYIAIAEVLGIDMPIENKPDEKESMDWVSALYPT